MRVLEFEIKWGELVEALIFGGSRRSFHALLRLSGRCGCGDRSDRTLLHGRECFATSRDDKVIANSLQKTGEFDFYVLKLSMRKLNFRRLGLLVDAGANIGTVAIPAVRRGLAESAIAIEGFQTTFMLLERNIECNALEGKIIGLNVAIGAAPGQVWFDQVQGNPGANSVSLEGQESEPTRLTTLDDILRDEKYSSALVFADIEGYEIDMLLGAGKLLESRIPFVMEFNPLLFMRYHSKSEGISLFVKSFSHFGVARSPSRRFYEIHMLSDLWDYLEMNNRATDLVFLRKS